MAHQLTRGQQIAYIPTHARHSTGVASTQWAIRHHPDVEFGFVTSQRGDTIFCRYWRKGHLGDLRTLVNSEGTPADCIVVYDSVPQSVVESTLKHIE